MHTFTEELQNYGYIFPYCALYNLKPQITVYCFDSWRSGDKGNYSIIG